MSPADVGRFPKFLDSGINSCIQIEILSCSTSLQFTRVSLLFQAPVAPVGTGDCQCKDPSFDHPGKKTIRQFNILITHTLILI